MTNPVSNHDMKVFTGLSNPDLSRRIARYCGVKHNSQADFELYTNGGPPVVSRSAGLTRNFITRRLLRSREIVNS